MFLRSIVSEARVGIRETIHSLDGVGEGPSDFFFLSRRDPGFPAWPTEKIIENIHTFSIVFTLNGSCEERPI